MTYTYDMRKIAVLVAIAGLLILLMYPVSTRAKAQGDTVGAPVKEFTTGTNKAEAVATTTKALTGTASIKATTTEKMTAKQERALIRELKAEIKRLQKLIKELTR